MTKKPRRPDPDAVLLPTLDIVGPAGEVIERFQFCNVGCRQVFRVRADFLPAGATWRESDAPLPLYELLEDHVCDHCAKSLDGSEDGKPGWW